jgi:hypothetical protein
MDIIQLFSVAGFGGVIGSLLTSFVQSWLSHKSYLANRNFQEKKEAYAGFLETGYESETQQTLESVMRWTYWMTRCKLVGSAEVIKLIERVEDTNPVDGRMHPDRSLVFAELMKAMRKDLGVELVV